MKRRPLPSPARAASFVAGCGRRWEDDPQTPELAYTGLAFPECPRCPHRVSPEGAGDFCTLRPEGRPHPFAALAGLKLE